MGAPTIEAIPDMSVEGLVRVPRGVTVQDLADRLGQPAGDLIRVLMQMGEMLTATQSMSDEAVALLAEEIGARIEVVDPSEADALQEIEGWEDTEADRDEDLRPRPPVVTVMGHVDHGKTKLLDAIRNTDVVAREAGGITQHIGAYQVRAGADGRLVTFIDTPGHEAFTAMRARGAAVTDVAVLVVAADDGVMPQTVEAINHAKAAGVPIVVAVNKVDKEDANPAKVRQQLTEYDLVAEEYGGKTQFVDVSAKTQQNLDTLVETILLVADVELNLKANPDRRAQGSVIEAHLDKGRGPVATILVRRGTLHVGDAVAAGTAFGRVRAMFDENGKEVTAAVPAQPVVVIGLSAPPSAGDEVRAVTDERIARGISQTREARQRQAAIATSRAPRLEDLFARIREGQLQELPLIIKADVMGSVEAIDDALGPDRDPRGPAAGAPQGGRRHHRGRRHPGRGGRGDHHRLLGAADPGRPRPGQPRGRRHPPLLGHLPGGGGHREGPQGPARPRVRGAPARHRRGPPDLPGAADRRGRRVVRHLGRGRPRGQGPPGPRRRGRLRRAHRLAAPLQGRRPHGRRRLRVRHRPGQLPGHQGRRPDRGLRDGRDPTVTRRPRDPAFAARSRGHPAAMFVALLRLDLRLPDAASLKDKRSVVKGLAAALRKLNCAVAEVDHQDLRQRATLAVATVAGEGFHARRVLVAAEREAERTPGVELLASDVTMYGPED